MDSELKREIILENFEHPFHKQDNNSSDYEKINTRNPNCIDNLDIYVLIQDNIIKDITFNGEACAISTSSTSIMIKNLIGMSVKDALDYIDNFYNMCDEKEFDEDTLKEALCYNDIYKQSNRKNCALLPYKGIKKLLEEYEK